MGTVCVRALKPVQAWSSKRFVFQTISGRRILEIKIFRPSHMIYERLGVELIILEDLEFFMRRNRE